MIYHVPDYGIVGDGITNNTEAINQLTKKIAETGGTIVFPKGEYLTGTVFLYDNTTLTLEEGATILGSQEFSDFPMIEEVEGYTRQGHWGLISALGCRNIRIDGKGTIDAQGEVWWESGKSDLVRPRTISMIQCKEIQVKDITIRNSPCWTVHPICCENVLVEGVDIFNPYKSPNTDGINPESCKNVRISHCHLDVGDDCVTIKAGTEEDLLQKQFPCENIVVIDCTMAHGHGGVVFGSEMSGGIRNVTVKNCVFRNTDRGIRVKTRRYRGGYIENLNICNIEMEGVHAGITFNTYYNCGVLTMPKEDVFSREKKEVTKETPSISQVSISQITGRDIKGVGIYLYGLPEMPIKDVVMKDISLEVTGNEEGLHAVLAPDRDLVKGEGIFLENTQGVTMERVEITCPKEPLTVINSKETLFNGSALEE